MKGRVFTGYESRDKEPKPHPFNPHKAKWSIIPDFPWGEDKHSPEKEITGTIQADGMVFGIIRLPNRETLIWLREHLNQRPPINPNPTETEPS